MRDIPEPLIKYYSEQVYSPSDDSYLMVDYFKKTLSTQEIDGILLQNLNHILDMGTGTGIIAIFFALLTKILPSFNPQIYASDIMNESIKYAKLNAELNHVRDKIKFCISDMFTSLPTILRNKLNLVLFNPPYLPSSHLINGNAKKNIDIAWNGGKSGTDLIIKFFTQLKDFIKIKREFYIYYITSSRMDLSHFYDYLSILGFKSEIIDKRHFFFEDIFLNKAEFE
jgi:HemK-related putative methylase